LEYGVYCLDVFTFALRRTAVAVTVYGRNA
jgi:hypothetical protein